MICVILACAHAGWPAGVLDTWRLRSSGVTNQLVHVTVGNGLIVAVGDSGTILTSSDGTTWSRRDSGTTMNLSAVAYGGNSFVAVGPADAVLVSPDGLQWTVHSVNANSTLNGIVFGNQHFVAAGGDTVLTSTNALQWAQQSLPETTGSGFLTYRNRYELTDVAYGNGLFVAVGRLTLSSVPPARFNAILTSSDGVAWTDRSKAGTGGSRSYPWLRRVTYGRGRFVAVGEEYISGGPVGDPVLRSEIFTSADGVDWVRSEFEWRRSGFEAIYALAAVAYGAENFVAVGDAGAILSSTDGLVWTQRVAGVSIPLRGITYANGIFLVVGDRGTILQSGITLTASGRAANGALSFQVTAPPDRPVILQASGDLRAWVPVITNRGSFEFVETNAMSYPQRFYRAQESK